MPRRTSKESYLHMTFWRRPQSPVTKQYILPDIRQSTTKPAAKEKSYNLNQIPM